MHKSREIRNLELVVGYCEVSNIKHLKFGLSEKGTKFEKNLPLSIWHYSVASNFKLKIFSNFVPFSECSNFKTLSRTGVKSLKDKHGATALLEVFDSMTLCHRFSWVRLSYKRKWKSVKFRIIHRCHNQLPHAGVGTSLFYFVKSPVSSHLPSILW